MNLADERVREQLAENGPVGHWRTVPGTHTVLLDDSIRFDADGSGEMRLCSVLRGTEELRFRWRREGFGMLACEVIYDEPILSDDGTPEPVGWSHIAFCFEQHQTDVGTSWVMRQRGCAGFWESMLPLVPA